MRPRCRRGQARTIERAQIGRTLGSGRLWTPARRQRTAEPTAIERVLVVGAGTMGSGIAQVIAQAGIRTT